jgi:dihydrolipoamide dehydrogenase
MVKENGMSANKFDLAVIGGGEAGIAAAAQGSESGAKVCLIEQSPQLGGACVATGTLPSKTLSISAGMLDLMKKIKNFGIRLEGSFALDFKEVLASRLRITRCDLGVIQSHLRSHGVENIQGRASFLAKDRIIVERDGGLSAEIEAPRIILAIGSRPAVIPSLPTNGRTLLSTDDVVLLKDLPSEMLIVGAGVIGCEYAMIFQIFGTQVVLVEKLEHALPGQDRDIVLLVEKELKRRGIRFLPGTTLTGCAETPEGRLLVTTDRGEQLATDKAVICIGRNPATEGLNLETVGIKMGKRGEILVDRRLQTTVPGIFAAGDVLGRRMLSSTAILEGIVAAENALGGDREPDERFIPSGILTQPEIGSVGITEQEASAQGIPYAVGACSYAGLVKACALYSHSPGLIKMIIDRESHRLLGAHIMGGEAAEIIHQIGFALKLGARAEDFVYAIYNHPSISEGFREAARNALANAKLGDLPQRDTPPKP